MEHEEGPALTKPRRGRPPGGRKFSEEVLRTLVPQCDSYSELARRLGSSPNGGTLNLISRRCREYGLDTRHMVGQAHGRGNWNRLPWKSILVIDRLVCRDNPSRLRRAMVESGIPYRCFKCGNEGTWMGSELSLDVDHINGEERDNRRENLRFACPNCHRQTDTWGRTSTK